jgi:hypothetical protein
MRAQVSRIPERRSDELTRRFRGRPRLTALVAIVVCVLVAASAVALMSPGRRSGSMGTPRRDATATLLADGRVLIAGGTTAPLGSDTDGTLASAEIYDPTTRTFTGTGSMSTPRSYHTAVLLPDGRVLLVGGQDGRTTTHGFALADMYDPKSGTFSPVGPVTQTPAGGSATLLSDGKVLLVDGFLGTAQVFDPKTGTVSPTGSMTTARGFDTQIGLSDGRVLVTGGLDANFAELASAEVYDPKTGTFSLTGSMSTIRGSQTATLLADGHVLVAGGTDCCNALASVELYDPRYGSLQPDGANGYQAERFHSDPAV